MKRYVLIVAGGRGLRMGGDLPKQFLPVADKPVLMHTLEAFRRWDEEAAQIVVLPDAHRPYWEMLCREIGCRVAHRLASGGESRFHSVRNGLEVIARELPVDEEALIAVHDGVRPLVSPEVIAACFAEAERSGAAVPVVPMVDSLREYEGDASRPVDRTRYVAVQTPQVFRSSLLLEAYRQPFSPLYTDDASVVEAAGHPVRLVAGHRENIKLTTSFDLRVAEALLSRRQGDF